MDVSSIIVGVVGLIGTTWTAVYGFMGTKNKNNTDLSIAERQILSADYQKLIQELKDSLDRASNESKSNRDEINLLRNEVRELREENFALLQENKKLNAKVEDLMTRLGGM